MISVEQALEEILGYVKVLEPEEKPILECLGQVLAEDIHSSIDVPPLDNSAMDGYAVRAADTQGANTSAPRILRVIGEVAAGSISEQEVSPGTAIRIMTGAPLPTGADAVVRFEDSDEVSRRAASSAPLSQIGICCQVPPGLNIRRAGEDIAKGGLVLSVGTSLRPPEIGVLASLGRGVVSVTRRPVVAVLATGDELVDIHEPLAPGKIYNSNTYTLAAQVMACGAIPKVLGIAPDKAEALKDRIHRGLESDLLVTSGGVSLGDYDMVKDVLAEEGEIAFWTVRMKPGKPLAFGAFRADGGARRVPHLGFPGNPVSSMTTFELFARPAILKMMGRKDLSRSTVPAIMESQIENRDRRRVFARVVLSKRHGQYFARLAGPQGSGVLTSMARANALAIVPEDVAQVREGDEVQVMMLGWGQEEI